MATINCPHRHKWVSQRSNVTWEFHDVTIYNDVCDHSDRCGHTACEYFDNSSEATRRFLKGLYHSHTLDGLFADKDYQAQLRQKHQTPPPDFSG
jgi:hypothetical protein